MRNSIIAKKLLRIIMTISFVTLVFILGVPSTDAEALNEKRSSFKSISKGKVNSSLSLSADIDNLVYDFEIKDTCFLTVSASAQNVTGDILFKITYNSFESAPLYKESVVDQNGGLDWTYRTEGVLSPGKYFLIISGGQSAVSTGKVKVKYDTESIKIHDNNNNNSSSYAQYQPFDGSYRTYKLSRLAPFGFEEDIVDWIYFDASDEGTYIRIETLNKFRGQIDMELYSYSKNGMELLNNYSIDGTVEYNRKNLPAGKYYIVFRWSDHESSEKTFDNSQVVYNVTTSPFIDVQNIKLSKKEVTLGTKGKIAKTTLTVKSTPETAFVKKTVWKSSDDKVVTVKNGELSAVGKGKATITCTVTGITGMTHTSKCSVEVTEQKVKLNKSSVTLTKGEKETLKASVSPKESVTWYSNDKSIAKVNDKGVITAVKAGKTTVYAKSKSGVKSAKCIVTVKNPPEPKKEEPKKEDSKKDPGSKDTKPTNPTKPSTPTQPSKPSQGSEPQNQSKPKEEEKPVTAADITLIVLYNTVDVGFNSKVTLVSGPTGGTWSTSSELSILKNNGTSIDVKGVKAGKGIVTYSVSGVQKSVSIKVE